MACMFTEKSTFEPGIPDALVDDERLLPGTEFGSYRIGDAIGAGAMGTVYRAEHSVLGKQVALKLMAPALRTEAESRQRFLLEAKTTAAIKHRHVIEIFDFGECQGNPYIVMELLQGQDLDRYLQALTRLSSEEAASLLLPIAAALASAHDAGVIHRDLKPSNIFLHHDPDGTLVPKLLDFGISKHTLEPSRGDFQGSSNQLLGSPHYLPPEAVNGCRDLTPRSDQYSFGVVLYECVTGRAPIERETLYALLAAIAHGEFAPPSHGLPDVPGPMENAILRCMQQNPAARFADMRELGRALLLLADGRARLLWQNAFNPQPQSGATAALVLKGRASSGSATLPPRRGPLSSRRRLLSLAAASACVLGVAGVALLATAPAAPQVEPALRAAREASPPGAEPPTPDSPRPLSKYAPGPEPVLHLAVSGKDDPGPELGGATSLRSAHSASSEGRAERASASSARAKRRARSAQRSAATAAARVRQPGAESGAAAGDPFSPRRADAENGAPAPDQRGALAPPGARDLGASGANESLIFD